MPLTTGLELTIDFSEPKIQNKKEGCYTYQLSRLGCEAQTGRSKTSISCSFMPTEQFLANPWKIWVVAAMSDDC